MIKIKVNPEDFVVEEVAGLPMRKHGNFCVYRLKKRGWNTVDVLKRISQTFCIPFSDLSYGCEGAAWASFLFISASYS
ncbi:MAG: tRNA pseudouridine(13) synthase TruD, partial [Planctomycetota bacterium]